MEEFTRHVGNFLLKQILPINLKPLDINGGDKKEIIDNGESSTYSSWTSDFWEGKFIIERLSIIPEDCAILGFPEWGVGLKVGRKKVTRITVDQIAIELNLFEVFETPSRVVVKGMQMEVGRSGIMHLNFPTSAQFASRGGGGGGSGGGGRRDSPFSEEQRSSFSILSCLRSLILTNTSLEIEELVMNTIDSRVILRDIKSNISLPHDEAASSEVENLNGLLSLWMIDMIHIEKRKEKKRQNHIGGGDEHTNHGRSLHKRNNSSSSSSSSKDKRSSINKIADNDITWMTMMRGRAALKPTILGVGSDHSRVWTCGRVEFRKDKR
eukprot:jgi/Bigna1/78746/fgenesh1_pg.56_\